MSTKNNTKKQFGYTKRQLAGWLRAGARLIESQPGPVRGMYKSTGMHQQPAGFCAVGAVRESSGLVKADSVDLRVSVAQCDYLAELARFNDNKVHSLKDIVARMRSDARAFEHGKELA